MRLISIFLNFYCWVYTFLKFLLLIFSVMTSFVFSLAGLINGIFAKKFDDISIIPTFVIRITSYNVCYTKLLRFNPLSPSPIRL